MGGSIQYRICSRFGFYEIISSGRKSFCKSPVISGVLSKGELTSFGCPETIFVSGNSICNQNIIFLVLCFFVYTASGFSVKSKGDTCKALFVHGLGQLYMSADRLVRNHK